MPEGFSYKNIVTSINDAVIVTNSEPTPGIGYEIIYVNPAFSRLTGYSQDEVIGESTRILQGPDSSQETIDLIRETLKRKGSIHTEILNYTKTGTPYWADLNIMPLKNPDGEVTHFAAIERDVTEYKQMQQELHRLSHTDALTGITNREHFMLLAETEFYRARRYHRPLSIIIFELDKFKRLNGLYGHQFGDDVLKLVAENCRTLLRQSDIFGRISGKKFALLLPETCIDAAEELADRLCTLLCIIQIKHKEEEIQITGSFGVTTSSSHDDNLFDLLERTGIALHEAKKQGRNTVRTKTVEPLMYLSGA